MQREGLSLVQRRSYSRRFAAPRTPPPGSCLAMLPVACRQAGSVNSGQNRGRRPEAVGRKNGGSIVHFAVQLLFISRFM